jgi:hypothetical protein
MYKFNPTKYELECGIFDMCVSEGAVSRTTDLLDRLYSELDINDYLDVLEYTLGGTDMGIIDDDLIKIIGKLFRVAQDKE